MLNEFAPHRFNNAYKKDEEASSEDFILCYQEQKILLKHSSNGPEIPLLSDFAMTSPVNLRYLFSLDERSCFLLPEPPGEPSPLEWEEVWSLRTFHRKELAWIGVVGFQLRNWYANHKFCGRCGALTALREQERSIICPACHHTVYPRISPAVIVAITCNDRILLARGTHYKGGFYALIAGYADVGESLEETVIREVWEEVGLVVSNIRYYKSQPWPFSESLMVGFFAGADDTQHLTIDASEIGEAAWFTRGKLPPHAPDISISGELIRAFEEGKPY
jgi:NAD+ diphosphatase